MHGVDMLQHFNPRSSCEERPAFLSAQLSLQRISIHAPHARSDKAIPYRWKYEGISIHAPHARSDFRERSAYLSYGPDFNPRSSCEERP